MAEERKPRGWGKFDALAKQLVAVPKQAVDSAIAKKKAKRRKRKRS